jgi:hypothetical protein
VKAIIGRRFSWDKPHAKSVSSNRYPVN